MKTFSKKALSFAMFMVVLSFFFACKKDNSSNDDNTPVVPSITVDSENQFSGKINGISFSWKDSNEALNYYNLQSTYSNDSTRYIYYSEIDKSSGSSAWEFFKIFKGTQEVQGSNYASLAQAKSFFAIGSYPYSNYALDGIKINFSYLDSTSIKSYTTDNVTQTGKSFKIDGIKEAWPELIRIKASFSCNLKDNNGNIVTLTDGVFVGDFSYTDF